jgi:uncharacterized protein
MRILTVSDKIEPVLFSSYIGERVGKVDLVLACGDLPYDYLGYIHDALNVPLFFVHGNHDRVTPPPETNAILASPDRLTWAVNLHCRTVSYRGLLVAGLEGAPQYNPGAPFQYTAAEVAWQALWLRPRLYWNRLRYGRYLDILVTHAPPRGIHDEDDLAHQGFVAYLDLMRRFRPLLMVHGHQHIYNRSKQEVQTPYARTQVINTYGYWILELANRPDGGWRLLKSGL